MLNHPTHNQLRALKLDGMADAFAELQTQDSAADLGHAEWLGLLIDRETVNRTTKRFQTRMRAAKLRHTGACVEDVDFRTPRKLDKALFKELGAGRWIADKCNLLIHCLTGDATHRREEPGHVVWAKPGSPAHSDKRPAVTTPP